MNNVRTGVLLIALTALLVYVGSLFGGSRGAAIAFAFALLMNAGSYWWSDRLVLRMYRAREVTEAEAPELYGIVAALAQAERIPMPRLYLIPSETPNAFATGRGPNHAAVAVTQGILRMLSADELRGVLAHELSHVQNRDILIGTVAATIVGAITVLASMARWAAIFGLGRGGDDDSPNPLVLLLVTALAAVGASLLQLAISRSREFEADASGARLIGNGEPLARALEKLEAGARALPMDANPATAHMFIVSPLAGGRGMGGLFARLFRTHPPTEERIERLRSRSWAR